jgi:thioester reductase-like protein
MSDVLERIASLSPEKRLLLMQRLKATQPLRQPPLPVIDLVAEAQLDASIVPMSGVAAVISPRALFLTGATGFLGAFLLDQLHRQTQATFYCLVRAPSFAAGLQRICQNLDRYQLYSDRLRSRIIPVPGDLSAPRLGLSAEQFDTLAHKIDWIYHAAASLNFVFPYALMKPINVLGTQEILRLACQGRPKPVHHMSSFAVFESPAYAGQVVQEEDPLAHGEEIMLGYAQSKWVAEKLVMAARDRGLPVSIYRLPLITGHSQTGVWNTQDFTCLMLKGCLQMRCAPLLDSNFSYAPVDYVARAIAYLSQQPTARGRAFHLNNPHPIHLDGLLKKGKSPGYPMEYLPYGQWQARLAQSTRLTNNALATLQPFFLERWSTEQLSIPERYDRARIPTVQCKATLKALHGSPITCPPMDSKLLTTYLTYLIQSGFLDAQTLGRKWHFWLQCLLPLCRPRQWLRRFWYQSWFTHRHY